MNRADLCVASAAAAPVSPDEVQRLIHAARSAWAAQRGLGLTDDAFDPWRKAALWDAVRRDSFRALGQREYGQALAHFAVLSGQRAPAAARREAGPEADRRRAEHVLREACAEVADAFGGTERALTYARALLARIHRADLHTATARQLWQVMYTLRNRGRARLRAALAEGGAK
jgi:hypothetical protein